jgi:hypothetical protein
MLLADNHEAYYTLSYLHTSVSLLDARRHFQRPETGLLQQEDAGCRHETVSSKIIFPRLYLFKIEDSTLNFLH